VLADVLADHGVDDLGDVDPGFAAGANHPAVAKDRHLIDDPLNLIETVRHIQDGGAAAAHAAQKLMQTFDLVFSQRRSRLIENDHARLHGNRFGDLHQLLLTHGKCCR
jgi:hypothetical protein